MKNMASKTQEKTKKLSKNEKDALAGTLRKYTTLSDKEIKTICDNPSGDFPEEFPFWARLKIGKNRTTLVIDEDMVIDKKNKKQTEGFVHREATSVYHKGFEEIKPNPDKDRAKKGESMFLKNPRKIPKKLVKPHNKQLDMPEHLKQRYSKNNRK